MLLAKSLVTQPLKTVLLCVFTAIGPAVSANAHGPFDQSARVILQEGALELNVTLGAEAAGLLLRDYPDALLYRGPTAQFSLPAEVASRLGTVSIDGTPLIPKSISIHAEQLESAISVVYERPQSGRLRFTPAYFTTSERLTPGVIEFTDDNGNRLGVAALTHRQEPAEIQLPGTPAPPQNLSTDSVLTHEATHAVTNVTVVSQPSPPAPKATFRGPVLLLAGFIATVVAWFVLSRKHPSR